MIAPGSPTVRRRRPAAELRGIREDKGKSGDAVAGAEMVAVQDQQVRAGQDRPAAREVERLLDYYQITGSHRALLLGLAEDATQKGWWEEFTDSLPEDYQQFIGLEHEAASMSIWHVDVVTGLLQTEGSPAAHHQQRQPGRAGCAGMVVVAPVRVGCAARRC